MFFRRPGTNTKQDTRLAGTPHDQFPEFTDGEATPEQVCQYFAFCHKHSNDDTRSYLCNKGAVVTLKGDMRAYREGEVILKRGLGVLSWYNRRGVVMRVTIPKGARVVIPAGSHPACMRTDKMRVDAIQDIDMPLSGHVKQPRRYHDDDPYDPPGLVNLRFIWEYYGHHATHSDQPFTYLLVKGISDGLFSSYHTYSRLHLLSTMCEPDYLDSNVLNGHTHGLHAVPFVEWQRYGSVPKEPKKE